MVLHSRIRMDYTVVSNRFIDKYLATANGEYVKVYLYLLRLQSTSEDVSVTFLADRLDYTEKDILRALRYWEKMQLLLLEEGQGGEIGAIILLNPDEEEEPSPAAEAKKIVKAAEPAAETAAAAEPAAEPIPVKTYSPSEIAQMKETDESFADFLFMAETYIGKTLGARDLEVFAYLHKDLEMPSDVLEYLVEYSVGREKRNIRYMEKVALSWHSEGLRSLEEIRQYTSRYTEVNSCIMKTLGIKNRYLAEDELKMIEKWQREYGMPLEVIREACSRSVNVARPFEYANKILMDWKDKGAVTLEKVGALPGAGRPKRNSGASGNANFEQRNIDYNAFLRGEESV